MWTPQHRSSFITRLLTTDLHFSRLYTLSQVWPLTLDNYYTLSLYSLIYQYCLQFFSLAITWMFYWLQSFHHKCLTASVPDQYHDEHVLDDSKAKSVPPIHKQVIQVKHWKQSWILMKFMHHHHLPSHHQLHNQHFQSKLT